MTEQSYIKMSGKMRFLLVDDDPTSHAIFRKQLLTVGYSNLTVATSGYEAFQAIQTAPPEFLMIRNELTDMSAIDLFSEIKNDLSVSRIPTLIFDEEFSDSDLAFIDETGIDSHLVLPFLTKDLTEAIARTWSKYINPKNVEFHFETARKLTQLGDVEKAEKIFRSIYDKGFLKARCKVAIAKCAIMRCDTDQALVFANEALKENNRIVHGYQLKGEIFLEQNRPLDAVKCFIDAITISPKNPVRYRTISDVLQQLGAWDLVEQILLRAKEVGIILPFVDDGLAIALLQMKKYKESLVHLSKLMKSFPEEKKYYNNAAVCYKFLGDLNRAIANYSKASDVDPKDLRIKYNLALVLIQKGKKDRAITILKEIIKSDIGYVKAAIKLAELTGSAMPKIPKNQVLDADDDQIIGQQVSPPSNQVKALKTLANKIARKTTKGIKQKIAPYEWGVEQKEYFDSLSDEQISYLYLMSLRTLRQQCFRLMTSWFAQISNLSEELAENISAMTLDLMQSENGATNSSPKNKDASVIALKKLMQGNRDLEHTLGPILIEIQFQDYLKQTLDAVLASYKTAYHAEDREKDWLHIIDLFFTAEDKNLISNMVFGRDAETEAEDNVIFF